MIAQTYEYLLKNRNKSKILIIQDDISALQVSHIASFLNIKHEVLPDLRALNGDDMRSFTNEMLSLNTSLSKFYNSLDTILIAPLRTILLPLPKKEFLTPFNLEFASSYNIDKLKQKLLNYGYSFVDVVESVGEVSIRGDILDIYPLGSLSYRVSFFDDEIESIREFEVDTQKSNPKELESIEILPIFLSLNSDQYELLTQRVEDLESSAFIKDINSLGFWVIKEYTLQFLDTYSSIFCEDMSEEIDDIYNFSTPKCNINTLKSIDIISKDTEFRSIENFIPNDILEFHKNKKITIIAKNDAILKQNAIEIDTKYNIVYKDIILNLMSNNELIISLNKLKRKSKKLKKTLMLDELRVGDFVVHDDYGVGVFKSIEPITVMGSTSDFIVLHYLADDKLLVPAQNLDVIDRYVANSGNIPLLDKLGKGSFIKNRDKIKKKLLEIASNIIDMAAKRELIKGIKIDTKLPEIKIFQSQAGFEYTNDQNISIKEIFDDLSSHGVMDRLLSGDVGFGKTEVAMNAIFAVVKSGYQAMFVVPTTLLSSQHYKSLHLRFAHHGIRVAKLDKFVSLKDKKYILKALENGDLDIVIGTHSLFNTKFKNLALIIVDEEHKFGVKQKESLKQISQNVHMLSMSATPIPRTLNMALSTIKGMSQLLTAPVSRLGVRTYVKEYSDTIIKEVILRELRRGGQIFYVFNSIAAIENKKLEILEILPKLKIAILHSKVSASESERYMMDFESGKYNMMLSTSIIESGLHLPNANTILIDGSDNFGIADLHQLRGRVGRGDKEGFCYFLVEDKDRLTSEATKRLLALENNSKLGSGYALAYQDLEIRGGGNILGENQSGHIKNIGYGLYLRMLEEAINLLSGTLNEKKKDVDIKLSISAYISTTLVSEDRVRLELYRRLSKCEEVGEVYEIEEEIIDRFGDIDQYSKQFLEIIIAKIMSADLEIKSISSYGVKITFTYENNSKDIISASSKDEDDILEATLSHLRALQKR